MKVVTSINPLWEALLVTPSIVGMALALTTTSSLAQSQQPTEPTLVVTQTVNGGLDQPTLLSPQTDSSTDQQAALSVDSAMLTQTSVNPLVLAKVTRPLPELTHPSLSFAPLQTPVESITQSRFTQANIDTDTKIETIGDPKADSPMLLAQSTDSRDLQPTGGSRSPSGGFSPAMLAQSADTPETPFPPDSAATPATGSTETPAADGTEAQTTATPTANEKWHFLFSPYIYVPFSLSGNANFRTFRGRGRDISRDFDFSPSQITSALRNSLDFAFFGALEAWTPNYKLGILANVDYLALSTDSTVTRGVRRPVTVRPPGSIGSIASEVIIPTELNADVNNQTLSVDLAATYRFYDPAKVNPNGVETEFDLGPVLFDVIGGMNITSVNSDLDLTTNLGGAVSSDNGATVVSPLLGGRFRWNTSPKFAVVVAGSVSGFGISGLSQYSFRTGIDWMFSGNTSLGLGYRFGFLNYNKGGDRDFSLEANQSGPYISFGFRF